MAGDKILFFSFYGHQYRYFSSLAEILAGEFTVFHINVYRSIFIRLFNVINPFTKKSEKVTIEHEELEKIIEFSYKKNLAGNNFLNNSLMKILYKFILKVQVKLYLKYFNSYFRKNEIGLVIVWNGLPHPAAAVTTLARKMGVKTLFLENGYLPKTLTVDPAGVNYANSLNGKDEDFYRRIKIDATRMKQLEEEGIRKVKVSNSQDEDSLLPDKFIFLPFQVYDDTQILIHSPLINNMTQFLDVCVQAVDQVNNKLNQDYWIIVKEHPQDVGRVDYDQLREHYQGSKVKILKEYDTGKLIKKSSLVVTINSTVGIEGLMFHKPVITLGNAFYNVDGLVYHVNHLSELSDRIIKALENDVDEELIDHFLYFLRYNYLVEANKNEPTIANNKMVINRIREVWKGIDLFAD